jgi:LTXXQ motif family protein
MVKTNLNQESEMRKSILSAVVVAVAAGALTFGSAQAVERGQGEFERICAPYPDRAAHEAKFAEFLGQRLKLNEAQKASFKDFQDARTKAVETATTRLCATKPDLSSFEGRLGFHQAFLEDRLEAVKAENPKLIAFYQSLDAGQKSKFDKFRDRVARKEGR